YGVAGDDYEGPPVFNDDQYEKKSVLVYDTDIEDVIEEEERFVGKGGFGGEEDCIEDVIVVANDFCSSMIQTTLNVDFKEDFNTKSHELMSFGKILVSSWYQEPKFLIKMSPKRSEGEDLEYPFFEGDGSSSDKWGDYGVAGDDYEGPPVFDDDQYEEESVSFYDTDIKDVMRKKKNFSGKGNLVGKKTTSKTSGDYGVAGDDYEGAPVFDDDYEEASVFDDDQFKEESMQVYDTDIEDVIEEEEEFVRKGGFDGEEDNIEDVVVVANDLCSSMIQTSVNVDFSKTVDSNPHELIWLQKAVFAKIFLIIGIRLNQQLLEFA
nr:hypothetical protein [Tanacetum cinerariifolium]